MQLTGANIKVALEQQWQRDGAGTIPSRPFLRLGVSEGFEYTYDPARPEGDRITGMWLNGEPIELATAYSVTVNSFLASGGDNFRAFNNGTDKRDTGQIDLQAMVDYMDEFASDAPLAVDYSQRAVGVSFPGGAPGQYLPGGTVEFDLSSLAMSTADDTKDNQVVVSLDGTELGTFPVNNTIGTAVFDEFGTASVSVTLPGNAPSGAQTLVVTGAATGTEVPVPITVGAPPTDPPIGTTTTATAADEVRHGRDRPRDRHAGDGVGSGHRPEGGATVATAPSRPAAGPYRRRYGSPGSHTLVVRYGGNASYHPRRHGHGAGREGRHHDRGDRAGDDAGTPAGRITVTPNSATGIGDGVRGWPRLGQGRSATAPRR